MTSRGGQRRGDAPALPVAALIAAAMMATLALEAPAQEAAPASLAEVLEAKPETEKAIEFADERRRAAMRDAAVSFGMQSGLVRRHFELHRILERYARQLDRVYRFDRLLVASGGFTVAPPVVVETTAAFRLGEEGRRAAAARRVLRIVQPAQVVSGPPGWRRYFERAWEKPRAPSAVLFPRTGEEEALWRGWVREGWADGVTLAEDAFLADLDRLNRDFEGIVTWRILETQRMASAPEIEVMAKPVVGGGAEMRLDEKRIAITVEGRLNPLLDDWRAVEETPEPGAPQREVRTESAP